MENTTKNILIAMYVIAVAGGCFYLATKGTELSPDQMKGEIISNFSNTNDPGFLAILNKMSPQELSDTLQLANAYKSGRKITDPALKYRLQMISEKYNIFT